MLHIEVDTTMPIGMWRYLDNGGDERKANRLVVMG